MSYPTAASATALALLGFDWHELGSSPIYDEFFRLAEIHTGKTVGIVVRYPSQKTYKIYVEESMYEQLICNKRRWKYRANAMRFIERCATKTKF